MSSRDCFFFFKQKTAYGMLISDGSSDVCSSDLRGAATPFGTDDSIAILAAAADDAPGDPQAAVDYVRGLIETGRHDDALARARHLAHAAPGAPAAQLLVGDVLTGRNGRAAGRERVWQ